MIVARPNILFLFSDQHRRDALGCAGHPHAQTPNLDRLAAGGARFTQSYAAAPICHPCRSALMTGRQVHRCRDLTTSKRLLDLTLPNLGTIFRLAGYATAAFGKVHVPGEDEEHNLGFDERALRSYTPKANDYQHTIGLENFWKYASYLPQYHPPSNPTTRNGINPANAPIELAEELIFDHMVTNRAIGFLQRHSGHRPSTTDDCPFFLWVGLEKPHNEMYAPKRFHDLYDPDRPWASRHRRRCPETGPQPRYRSASECARRRSGDFRACPAANPSTPVPNSRTWPSRDVLSTEPPAPDNPLLTARNCFITPHIAWATVAARRRLMQTAYDNVQSFLDGGRINVVNVPPARTEKQK